MKTRSLGFTPGRLTLAREAIGWSKRELAIQTGLSDAALGTYELGTRVPTPDTVQILAKVLNYPLEYFFQPEPPTQDTTVFYRTRHTSERVARQRAQAHLIFMRESVQYLEQVAHLPGVRFPRLSALPENPYDITRQMIEDAAVTARKFWNLGDGPVPNLVWLLESCGAVVTRLDLSSDRLDALSTWSSTDNRPYIILNDTRRNAFRSRADLAHELGHLLLHRHLRPDVMEESETFKVIEEQAWAFAHAFLLPEGPFLRDVYTLNLDALLSLKPKWKVSVAFMLRRIHRAGILTSDKFTNYRKYMANRDWLQWEPYDAESEPEKPMMLQDFVDFLVNNKLRTQQQILSGLAYPPEILERIMKVAPGFFTHTRNSNTIPFTPKRSAM